VVFLYYSRLKETRRHTPSLPLKTKILQTLNCPARQKKAVLGLMIITCVTSTHQQGPKSSIAPHTRAEGVPTKKECMLLDRFSTPMLQKCTALLCSAE
jgi:hypothetical protein